MTRGATHMPFSHNEKKLLRQLNEAYLDELEDELKFVLVHEPGGRTYYQLDGTRWYQTDGHILPFDTVRISEGEVESLQQAGFIQLTELGGAQFRVSITADGRACIPEEGKPWKEMH